MLKIIREYINYQLKAKGRHGVHSPFVYEFVDKCLRQNVDKTVFKRFKRYKKQLNRDNSSIEVTDLGAGSKKLSRLRKVMEIARVSGTSKKYGKLLFKLVNFYQPKTILELGTSVGIGTFMLASGSPKSKVITVEGCPETSALAREKHNEFQNENIHFVVSDFVSYLKNYKGEPIDFVFIDGDHKGEKLLELLDLLSDIVHDETIILLDDIRWSQDMLNTWNKLIENKKFHLTIDLFKMGIIMPRTHQEKEHFVIRY